MPGIKEHHGPDFDTHISGLVSWFMQAEGVFEPDVLRTAIEEILEENDPMSDLALQTSIRERYAKKKGVVLQAPALSLNPTTS